MSPDLTPIAPVEGKAAAPGEASEAESLRRRVAALEARLGEREQALQRATAQLALVSDSGAYRIVSWLQRLRRGVAPEGSRRHRVLRRGWQLLVGESAPAPSGEDAAAGYARWLAGQLVTPRARQRFREQAAALQHRPLVSLLMPVYNPPVPFLREAVASVGRQVWERWELCIADDGSVPAVAAELDRLATEDDRIRVVHLPANRGIAGATNAALAMANGMWVGFLDHDDVLHELAILHVVKALGDSPDLDVVYTDRDHVTADGERVSPYFKPDWSPLTILSHNFAIHFLVVRRSLLNDLGGLKTEFDGAQDFDLVLRLAERTDRVLHIPRVLYSWRIHPGSNAGVGRPAAFEAGRRAIADALARRGVAGSVESLSERGPYRVRFALRGRPLVSIVISSRDPKMLAACTDLLRRKTTYDRYEILVATNAVGHPELRRLCEERGFRLVEVENGFFSRMNNAAARAAGGEFVLFLNDDTEIVTPDWLEELLGWCQQDGVTAVGPKLVHRDGRIQFTRVVMGIRRDGVPYFFDPFDMFGVTFLHGFSSEVSAEVRAVSGGAMLVRKEDFLAHGGFEEETFAFSYQDVDWSLRAAARGGHFVYTPHAVIVHYGSFSKKLVPDMMEREIALASEFFARNRQPLSAGDPFLNPNLLEPRGLVSPPRFPGLPRHPLREEPPSALHALARCRAFAGDPGGEDSARSLAACRVFAERLKAGTGCRRVLDIGCGRGDLVEALTGCGVDAWGVERSSRVLDSTSQAGTARIVRGDITTAATQAALASHGPFDVLVATGVLERLPEDVLTALLPELARLAPTWVVTVPPADAWEWEDPFQLCGGDRGWWRFQLASAGMEEAPELAEALFGPDWGSDPEMVLYALRRRR
ncbi:MAG: glycosyltransferase [Thermoanaerobaculaceae bacterium]|nr:glycosyltransferase [Thermoanaerobaculaceae bacterium]